MPLLYINTLNRACEWHMTIFKHMYLYNTSQAHDTRLRLRLFGSKTFSAFSGVWDAVKPKSTKNKCKLTGKSQRKIRKMVYGKFFRKPFSKTRVRLPLDSFHSHSVSALSLSHCLLYSFHGPEPPPATPSHPEPPPSPRPNLCSLSFFLYSLSLSPSQPEPPRRPLSHWSPLAPIPPSHSSCPAPICFSQGNPHRRTAWSDQIRSDLISFFFFRLIFGICWSDLFFFFRLIFGICWFSLVNSMIFGNCL